MNEAAASRLRWQTVCPVLTSLLSPGESSERANCVPFLFHRDEPLSIYLARGELQESLGLLDDAAAGYRAGLAQLRGAILVKLALIRVEIASKRYDQALEFIDQEIARAAVKTEWYLRRAEVLTTAHKKKEASQVLQQALAEANRVLSKRATALQLISRARVLRALGNTDAAVRDVELALTKSPRYQVAIDFLSELKESVSK